MAASIAAGCLGAKSHLPDYLLCRGLACWEKKKLASSFE